MPVCYYAIFEKRESENQATIIVIMPAFNPERENQINAGPLINGIANNF
jgi:hypothetical protein